MASKFLMNQAIQDAEAIDQSNTAQPFNWRSLLGIPNTGVGNDFARARGLMTDVPQYAQNYYQRNVGTQPFPHEGMQAPGFMEEPSGVGEGYDQRRFKDVIKDKFSGLTTPMMALLKSQRNNPEENFGLDYFNTNQGRVAGSPVDNLYSNMNVASGFGKGLNVAGQKRIDRIEKTLGSKYNLTDAQIQDIYAGKFDEEKSGVNTALIQRLKNFKDQQTAYQNELKANTGQVIEPANAGAATTGAAAYGGPPTRDFNPTQAALAGGYKGAGTSGSYAAGPQSGSGYGPWSKRDGGRIGYQGGELVEQETDFIQGPQGGEEFQETVVEGQDQPSREQLEALAMEIFQLPLEELDEQQLLVVYQEAMQGQPMEESVQEDEVQFAAQGGLAGLL